MRMEWVLRSQCWREGGMESLSRRAKVDPNTTTGPEPHTPPQERLLGPGACRRGWGWGEGRRRPAPGRPRPPLGVDMRSLLPCFPNRPKTVASLSSSALRGLLLKARCHSSELRGPTIGAPCPARGRGSRPALFPPIPPLVPPGEAFTRPAGGSFRVWLKRAPHTAPESVWATRAHTHPDPRPWPLQLEVISPTWPTVARARQGPADKGGRGAGDVWGPL